ncbi:MAG: hypothetical protein ACREML_09030 [Vulcanimicrobiaceae bacterium]
MVPRPLDVSVGTIDSTPSNVTIPLQISEGFQNTSGVQTASYTGMISINLGTPDSNIATACVTIPNLGPPGCSFTVTNSSGVTVGVDYSVGNP